MCSNGTTYIYIHIHMYVSNAIYLGIWMDNKNDVGVVDDDDDDDDWDVSSPLLWETPPAPIYTYTC